MWTGSQNEGHRGQGEGFCHEKSLWLGYRCNASQALRTYMACSQTLTTNGFEHLWPGSTVQQTTENLKAPNCLGTEARSWMKMTLSLLCLCLPHLREAKQPQRPPEYWLLEGYSWPKALWPFFRLFSSPNPQQLTLLGSTWGDSSAWSTSLGAVWAGPTFRVFQRKMPRKTGAGNPVTWKQQQHLV